MISDRFYMRDARGRDRLTATTLISIALVVAFVLQTFAGSWTRGGSDFIARYLALSVPGLKHGYLWQLVTFQFLHGGVFHLICNLIGLICFGRFVEIAAGRSRFLLAYFGAGIAGGLLQALFYAVFQRSIADFANVYGASAGVCGLITVFCLLRPDEHIQLYMILPVKARWFLWGLTAISVLYTVAPGGSPVAHTAHLGGILFGFVFVRARWHEDYVPLPWTGLIEKLKNTTRSRPPVPPKIVSANFRDLDLEDADYVSREVDPILDKIAQHGIQSLTERERRILEAAKDRMGRT
jgi:membrane associated rhomboid family serine protease